MAITWKRRVLNSDTGKEEWVDDGTSHVGLVMSNAWTKEQRVMSDVYAPVSFCRVWDPLKKEACTVNLGANFECETRVGTPIVDIAPKILKAWEADQARKAQVAQVAEAARLEQDAEDAAERELKQVRKGAQAIVVRGRKVPKGTQGVIIWTGQNDFGSRVGLKDSNGDVHWTAESNVEVLLDGLKPGEVPPGGWKNLHERKQESERGWKQTFPQKGDSVRILNSGVEGRVFWAKDERLGVRRKRAPKNEDPTWCNAWDVAVIDAKGKVLSQTPRNPPPMAPVGPKKSPFFEGLEELNKKAPEPRVNPLAHLPFPLCEIAEVKEENGMWGTYTKDGDFVMKVTENGAHDILALLSGAE